MSMPGDGDVSDRLRRIEQRLSAVERVDRLNASSITVGNLRLRGGTIDVTDGSIVIRDGAGDIQLELSTDGLVLEGALEVGGSLDLPSGSDITLDGGQIVVNDGAGSEVFRASPSGLDLTGTLTVDGSVVVETGGTVEAGNFASGTSGFRFDGTTGDAELNELTLRDGIIGDDALANLVRPVTDGSSGGDGTTNTGSRSLSITVPSWANNASVLAFGSVQGTAGVGDAARFQATVAIAGNSGASMEAFVSEIDFPPDAVASAHHERTLTSPGSSIAVELSWGAQGVTTLTWVSAISALVVFTR